MREETIMKYDFDQVIDRHHSDSYKWNYDSDILPMWTADMDFKVATEITDALVLKAGFGLYGYSIVPDSWYEAYIGFWKRHYHFTIVKDWLLFSSGVVPTISSVVRKLTTPAEKVLLLTPVYNIFYNSILNNGRVPLEEELVFNGSSYSIDFLSVEDKMSDPQCSLMILCNPENPVGKIFTAEELQRIGELAKKHHVIVLSDEIHGPITMPGKDYIPFASVSEVNAMNSVTAISPTKAFNLAGLQTSAVVVPDPTLRHRVNRQLNTDEVAEPNYFAVTGAVAAFTKGDAWLEEMRAYVAENRKIASVYFAEHIPELHLIPGEATYLLWIDVKSLTLDGDDFADFLLRDAKLLVCKGSSYGKGGKHFFRLNIACPRATLLDGLKRIQKAVRDYSSR